MSLNYSTFVECVASVIHARHLPEYVVEYALDAVDLFTCTPTFMREVEKKYCVKISNEWRLFGRLHGPNDECAKELLGNKMWFKNNVLHREHDLPAKIQPASHAMYWYKYGKLHRDNDNPAMIICNEPRVHTRVWFKNGFLHRNNGPAIEKLNGTKSWWRNGYVERIEFCEGEIWDVDGQNVCITSASTRKEWFVSDINKCKNNFKFFTTIQDKIDKLQEVFHFVTHRDDDLPAIVEADGSMAWFWFGNLHRENDQPAVILSNGTQEWHFDGRFHREEDRPAIVDSVNQIQKWYMYGKLHREDDKPAVVGPDYQEWYVGGQRHRHPLKGPAVIRTNGKLFFFGDENITHYVSSIILPLPS